MNNNDNNIEILDDFDFDLELDLGIKESNQNTIDSENTIGPELNNIVDNNGEKKESEVISDSNNEQKDKKEELEVISDSNNEQKDEKEELENPMIEIVNNKQTMRLILIMLVVLFIAVFLMPNFFELINTN